MTGLTDIVMEDVSNLLLDPDNPRLSEDVQGGEQLAILRHIARHEAVEDLMAAIGHNGFFRGEPLVVYRSADDPKGKLRVIEGNRRLASVKLLLNPGLYPNRKSIKEIADETPQKHKPSQLPVIKVASREAALPYLGSRHIVGVKAWEPLPKARYMRQLFKLTGKGKSAQARYREVATQIGSGKRTDYIKKNLNALAVYEVISKADFFGDKSADEMSFNFGVLYTALGDRKSIAGFVGVVEYNAKTDQVIEELDPIIKPSVLKKDSIAELYKWCFKKDPIDGTTVLGESRNLAKLAAVLRSASATEVLRKTNNLDLAYDRSGGLVTELADALSMAFKSLQFANSVVANARVDEVVIDLSSRALEQARQLDETISSKSSRAKAK